MLSAGWLTLTRGWGQPRVVAAALLAVLAGGLLAVRLRRPIDRLIVALGPWEGRLVWGGVPGLAMAMAGSLGLAILGPPLALTGSPPAAVRPVMAGEQGLAAARPAVAAERPNVLLITVDTLRADHLSSYGARPGQTPTLDRLAVEGARFVWAFAQQPNTNGQHASLFTGTYPATHGVRVHMVDRLPADLPTLAEVLQAAGYATAGIYSWISLEPAFSGLERGFAVYQGYVLNRPEVLTDGRMQYLAATVRRLTEYVAVVRTADLVLQASHGLEDRIDGRADVTTDAALQWLQQGRRPFFLWVHYFDPHYPYTPPPPYDRQFDPDYTGDLDGSLATIRRLRPGVALAARDRAHLLALYDGEVAFTDAQIGRLVATLATSGLLDQTIVIVTGDHGESFGEHDAWLHGTTLYNTEVHVPLLVRYPARITPGTVVTAPVQGIDIMPTVLDLLGLPVPPTVEGRSLVPLLTGASDGGDREAISQTPDDRFLAIARDGWKLILDQATGRPWLYHLASDPAETRDLAADYPQIVRWLEDRLHFWKLRRGAAP